MLIGLMVKPRSPISCVRNKQHADQNSLPPDQRQTNLDALLKLSCAWEPLFFRHGLPNVPEWFQQMAATPLAREARVTMSQSEANCCLARLINASKACLP
jgi:hypothetical protein